MVTSARSASAPAYMLSVQLAELYACDGMPRAYSVLREASAACYASAKREITFTQLFRARRACAMMRERARFRVKMIVRMRRRYTCDNHAYVSAFNPCLRATRQRGVPSASGRAQEQYAACRRKSMR